MEIEYSTEVKGKVFAYRFEDWEKQIIAKCLATEIKKRERKIESIRNHPKNEGQVTYYEKMKELGHEIMALSDIVKEFTK